MALKFPQFGLNPQNCFRASVEVRKYPSSVSSFSLFVPFFSQRLKLSRGNTAIVAAAKKDSNSNNNSNKRKKDDKHNFASRPDEAIGPFPEAVLLKEKKVEEDGRLMPEFADVEERELFEALNLQLESDMDVDQMRHYEVVYMIHENYKEEVENVNEKVQEFLQEKKGRIWRFSDWGMRRLAYNIQKAKNAHYILMNFQLEGRWINDLKSMLDRDERVIRHLVMKKDKAETWECPPPPEFHTLRADMNDDDDDEDEDDDMEYDDEDYDDEEIDDGNDGVIYVDDDVDEPEMISNSGRSKQKAEKVAR